MKEYDEYLEDLLLDQPYAALNEADRSYADSRLGGGEAYTAERNLRLRTRTMLVSESAPADEGGAARLMARVGPRGWAPWQVAAAVCLAALLAWSARGLLPENSSSGMERFAVADTVLKEVRIMDTVYLPAPESGLAVENREHPLLKKENNQEPKREAPARRRRPQQQDQKGKVSLKLAATIAQMPDPGTVTGPAAVQLNPRMPQVEVEARGDKFNLW